MRAPLRLLLGLATQAGCPADPTPPLEVTARVEEDIALVIEVAWSTPSPASSHVAYGIDGKLDRRVEAGDGTDHLAHLVGLPPLTDVAWRAFSTVDGEDVEATGTLRTGNPPAELPTLTAVSHDPAGQDPSPYLLGTQMNFTRCNLFVIDREGTLLWYWQGAPDEVMMASYLAADGQRFLYNVFDVDFVTDIGAVRSITPAGDPGVTVSTPMAHHAFDETPDGSLVWLSIDIRDWFNPEVRHEQSVVGDAVFVGGADREPVELWNAWDHWGEPFVTEQWDLSFYPQGKDWTHGNAVNHDEASGTLLVSLANANTVLELDATTGEVRRQLGGPGGYTVNGQEDGWSRPHDARWCRDGTLMVVAFDDTTPYMSRYTVDDAARDVREGWTWGRGEDWNVIAQSEAHEMENGNVLFALGTSGALVEVTEDGEVVWEASADVGYWFGLVHEFSEWPGVTRVE